MALTLPNGSIVSVSTGLNTAKTVSAATNANPSVLTSTAHGLANGTLFLFNSGWPLANARVFRVANTAANALDCEGLDATNTTLFPSGSGVGTIQQVTAFQAIPEIMSLESNGGDQQYYEYQFLEASTQKRVPTIRSAVGIDLTVAFDTSNVGYQELKKASDNKEKRVIKVQFPTGRIALYYGDISVASVPIMTVNEGMTIAVSISLASDPVFLN